MLTTTNYQLVKQELTDRADITQISGNWDKIDTQLKKLSDEKFDKTGGTITGGTTISKGGLSVTGGTTTDALTANGKVTAKGGVDVTDTLTASGKVTANGGLAVTGATSLASLTTTGATIVPTPSANNHAATKKYVDDAITGKVEFNSFRLRSTVISRGTAPSTAQSLSIDFYDKDGLTNATDRLARIGYTLGTDNAGALTMGANNPKNGTAEDLAGIIAQWLADGTARISVTHHPATGSNDKSIATTYWVRSLTATTSEYGLVKLADETALLSEADDATLTVDASYELNDFRRMNTAYAVGDKVNCAFNFGVFLECTQAGTTSAETLDTRSVIHGQVISDGTVQWTVRTHVKSINGNVPDASGNVSIDTVPPIATTEEAQAGADDTKMMTPLKTKQAINALAGNHRDEVLAAATKALEIETNPTGNTVDLAAVMSAVSELQTLISPLVEKIKAYVVETGTTASGWYRLYSDGWIEQGGYFDPTSATMTISIKEMANTDYTVLLTDSHSSTIQQSCAVASGNKKTTSFNCKCNTAIAGNVYWRVSGFAKVG